MSEQNWAYQVPEIITDQRVPQSEEEAAYLALVRLCHERGEWYPQATYAQCMGYTDQPVRRPHEQHPVLEDPKYHRYEQADEPLNQRGRRKLAWMQHKHEKTINDYWEITLAG
jgi:hypothetical protein